MSGWTKGASSRDTGHRLVCSHKATCCLGQSQRCKQSRMGAKNPGPTLSSCLSLWLLGLQYGGSILKNPHRKFEGLLCAFRRLTVRSFHWLIAFSNVACLRVQSSVADGCAGDGPLRAQLGLWHSAVHVVHSQHDHASAQPGPDVARTRGASAWERLFSSHEDAADCLFFDPTEPW